MIFAAKLIYYIYQIRLHLHLDTSTQQQSVVSGVVHKNVQMWSIHFYSIENYSVIILWTTE